MPAPRWRTRCRSRGCRRGGSWAGCRRAGWWGGCRQGDSWGGRRRAGWWGGCRRGDSWARASTGRLVGRVSTGRFVGRGVDREIRRAAIDREVCGTAVDGEICRTGIDRQVGGAGVDGKIRRAAVDREVLWDGCRWGDLSDGYRQAGWWGARSPMHRRARWRPAQASAGYVLGLRCAPRRRTRPADPAPLDRRHRSAPFGPASSHRAPRRSACRARGEDDRAPPVPGSPPGPLRT